LDFLPNIAPKSIRNVRFKKTFEKPAQILQQIHNDLIILAQSHGCFTLSDFSGSLVEDNRI
jgi:hypothetical protein